MLYSLGLSRGQQSYSLLSKSCQQNTKPTPQTDTWKQHDTCSMTKITPQIKKEKASRGAHMIKNYGRELGPLNLNILNSRPVKKVFHIWCLTQNRNQSPCCFFILLLLKDRQVDRMETGRKTDWESRTSAASELLARCGVRADGAVVGRARQETLEREKERLDSVFLRALKAVLHRDGYTSLPSGGGCCYCTDL